MCQASSPALCGGLIEVRWSKRRWTSSRHLPPLCAGASLKCCTTRLPSSGSADLPPLCAGASLKLACLSPIGLIAPISSPALCGGLIEVRPLGGDARQRRQHLPPLCAGASLKSVTLSKEKAAQRDLPPLCAGASLKCGSARRCPLPDCHLPPLCAGASLKWPGGTASGRATRIFPRFVRGPH